MPNTTVTVTVAAAASTWPIMTIPITIHQLLLALGLYLAFSVIIILAGALSGTVKGLRRAWPQVRAVRRRRAMRRVAPRRYQGFHP